MTAVATDPALVAPNPEQKKSSSPRTVIQAALSHPMFDYNLVIVTAVLLLCLGLMMVISASSVIAAVDMNDPYYFGKRQILFAIVGVLGAAVLSRFSERLLQVLAWPSLALAIILLLLTFSPLGVDVAGNQNWLVLGPSWTQFQPSEFAKLAIILWGANDLSRRRKHLIDMRQWLTYLVAVFTIIILVVVQKDLGTAIVMTGMVLLILMVAGAPWRLLAALVGAGILAVVVMIKLAPNRMSRILAFMDPNSDLLGSNLQPRRSLYALATGGWFGLGLGASRQKWGLLSEAHTDYIFAIIGEELGLVGTLTVIALFAALAFAGIRIARRSKSNLTLLVATGVVAWFTVQAFVNIAVAIRLIPVMGVTLPMISYGGSSLMANLFGIGLLIGCARREPDAVSWGLARKRVARSRSIIRETL